MWAEPWLELLPAVAIRATAEEVRLAICSRSGSDARGHRSVAGCGRHPQRAGDDRGPAAAGGLAGPRGLPRRRARPLRPRRSRAGALPREFRVTVAKEIRAGLAEADVLVAWCSTPRGNSREHRSGRARSARSPLIAAGEGSRWSPASPVSRSGGCAQPSTDRRPVLASTRRTGSSRNP